MAGLASTPSCFRPWPGGRCVSNLAQICKFLTLNIPLGRQETARAQAEQAERMQADALARYQSNTELLREVAHGPCHRLKACPENRWWLTLPSCTQGRWMGAISLPRWRIRIPTSPGSGA